MKSMRRMAFTVATMLVLGAASIARAQVATLAFGTGHAMALRNNGDVLTWGGTGMCELGRKSPGNGDAPAIVMRNAREIAAAVQHSLVLTADGKVYAWGSDPVSTVGLGDANSRCEGPVLVPSLAGKTVAHVATGYGFSVVVTSNGDLYCTGENDMGQCPVSAATRVDTFMRVPYPELAGKVAAISTGMFHTLVLTTDGKLYAFGRGRDGQLGNSRTANGFALVPEMTGVVSMAAGTWHSVVVRSDGTAWVWGHNGKSQLCDGTTMNQASPLKVSMPGGARVTRVSAGGHSTVLQTADGALYGCGDNQAGLLGIDALTVVPRPTRIPVTTTAASALVMGGAHAGVLSNCAVSLAGDNHSTIIAPTNATSSRVFVARPNLTMCGPRGDRQLPDIVSPAPGGGESGCWTPHVEENAVASSTFAGALKAMLAAESILKRNAAFLAAPVPVRFRTTLGAGPSNESGAQMHVKVVPERKPDGFRVWGTGPCEVIPQVDRIGGPIFQVSIFFNTDPRANLIGVSGEVPKLTGMVGGYPEYNNWIVITKNARLPWVPNTVAEKIDAEGTRRRKALDDWRRGHAVRDVATAEFEKQIRDYEEYRASFTAEQLRAPAVWADASGTGKRALDAQIASLQRLTPDEQRQADAWGQESRAIERQAQVEAVKNKNAAEATRLRAQANELANKVRALRQAHMDAASPRITDALAQYQLVNIKAGSAAQAMSAKADPSFPDYRDPNRIQLITISFSVDPDARQAVRRAWQEKAKASFDFAALAALLN